MTDEQKKSYPVLWFSQLREYPAISYCKLRKVGDACQEVSLVLIFTFFDVIPLN